MKLEMRTLKNIAAAAMTLAVVFGAASLKPVTANAAEASVSASIEEENSYISFQDEAYQNEFLRRVNNERAKAGLKPVQLGDSSHNSAAQERAEELAVSYSYVRPNGQRDFTILAENGIDDVSVGENYIAGVSTPDAAVDQWMNIDFARERMLNADVTTMSVGHYEGGAYNNYWVLIFSYPETLTPATTVRKFWIWSMPSVQSTACSLWSWAMQSSPQLLSSAPKRSQPSILTFVPMVPSGTLFSASTA